MTYREKIKQMVQGLQNMYDEADALCDMATLEEKQYWDAFRTKLPDCWYILEKIDNSMADKRAAVSFENFK